MSLVFREGKDLKTVAAESAVIVVAAVERLSREGLFTHVRVERVLRGDVAAGAELEIHPAGHQMGCQSAESMANGGPSFSFTVQILDGKAPAIKAGKNYVFFLQPGFELAAMNAWRAASEADAIAALI
jgi:hypothetical protein